jgi:hypothetical protein
MSRFDLVGETVAVDTARVNYRVVANSGDVLPPVTLIVNTGVASVQDYLTPDEADALAEALSLIAREARVTTP